MNDFEAICNEFEKDETLKTQTEITEKAIKVIEKINALCDIDGAELISDLIVACVTADGGLKEIEYDVIRPALEKVLGEKFNKEVLRAGIVSAMNDFKEFSDKLDVQVDALGEASTELKKEIIFICISVCACDGKISYKESKWLKKLAE